MAKFELTKKAVKDLSGIWEYTFDTWSEKQADKYYKQILSECNRLSIRPEDGRSYQGIVESLRGKKINKHIILYRVLGKQHIEVARILHERMDLKSRIAE